MIVVDTDSARWIVFFNCCYYIMCECFHCLTNFQYCDENYASLSCHCNDCVIFNLPEKIDVNCCINCNKLYCYECGFKTINDNGSTNHIIYIKSIEEFRTHKCYTNSILIKDFCQDCQD